MTQFRNEHLSFSRLSLFEQCPLSYRFKYIEKREGESNNALRFGKAIHRVLEQLLLDAIADEHIGVLPEDRALVLFKEAWVAEGLRGIELFQQGQELLQRFIREQGVLDQRRVLAIEKQFHLSAGPFTVLGYIDRVDCVDNETVEVIDYKTNFQLFTRDEVDSSLQLSLYALAAHKLWPWAKKVKLTYWMLRHGLRQQTERSPEQLDAALSYVEMLGKQSETSGEYPARLNTNCPYCSFRAACPAYGLALKGARDFVCPDLADLEAVSKERAEVARIAKIAYARKEELDHVLKAHLKEQDELVLGGVKYRMFNATKVEYPLAQTIERLGQVTGKSWNELVTELAVIDPKALDSLMKKVARETDKSRVLLLKAELEAGARVTHSPRLWAKEVSR
jgi:RecB family exonuclease